jgi:hypothetical protein
MIELREKISYHERYIKEAKADYYSKVRGLSLDLGRFND